MVFYFIVILPEQKKQNSRKTMLDAMKHDDEVVTTGGIYGKVTAIADQVVTLEISQGVRIKVLRTAIAGIRGKETKDGKEAKDKDK
ncbi:MAG: preprotein translocase subunit YajC [Burkholderiales bacterium RIFOXYC12_FULL_60_6]|nr:MAG: preprotein translocase subunit YajC [Burkholderiales bacterium RIFOXYC12_FULL_60_6]